MKIQFARPRLGWSRKWMLTLSDERYGTVTWAPPDRARETIQALVNQRKLRAIRAVCRDSLDVMLGMLCLARHLSRPRGLPAQLNLSIKCRVTCRL